jgi:methylisocitrate lyase
MATTSEFRTLVEREEILPAMGGYDALSAKIIEQSGGEVVYMSGSSVSTSVHGYPDVGVTTMTEMVNRAHQMAQAVDIPVFCDADTGYGNPINVKRTVEEYESAGVAGIHLEDQEFPKKCGHFEGKDVVGTDEMVQKLRAAVDARDDEDFQIIARTDARAVEGMEAAITRSHKYVDAGADILFFEAPESREEIEHVAEEFDGRCPLLVNMTEGGQTPLYSAQEFEDMGADVVLYPATAFKAAAKAFQRVYETIAETGSQADVMDELVAWDERNEITGLEDILALEDKYAQND